MGKLHSEDFSAQRSAIIKQRRRRRSDQERLADAIRQRDEAASKMVSADRRIFELNEQVRELQQRIDDLLPPPIPIVKR